MIADHSLLSFFTHAGMVVKIVMLILLAASLASWTFIIQRALYLKDAKANMKKFEDGFWQDTDLVKLYSSIKTVGNSPEGMAHIFFAGFKEYIRLRKQNHTQQEVIMEGVQRAMRVAATRESDKLEQHLSFLATVGSTSPYVGLFGTVWGIMTSFQALGTVTQATIAMVAPGISEALIATAMGLFAAIPAVIAYNRYANSVERIENQYDSFQQEFSNLLARQLHVSLQEAG